MPVKFGFHQNHFTLLQFFFMTWGDIVVTATAAEFGIYLPMNELLWRPKQLRETL